MIHEVMLIFSLPEESTFLSTLMETMQSTIKDRSTSLEATTVEESTFETIIGRDTLEKSFTCGSNTSKSVFFLLCFVDTDQSSSMTTTEEEYKTSHFL